MSHVLLVLGHMLQRGSTHGSAFKQARSAATGADSLFANAPRDRAIFPNKRQALSTLQPAQSLGAEMMAAPALARLPAAGNKASSLVTTAQRS